ncbi:MAG TPA: glycoside hydrolase family 76 protein [Clostridia bacterium]
MKKIISIIIGVVLIASFELSCANPKNDMFDGFDATAKKYAQISVELNDLVKDNYWINDTLFAFHYYPNYDGDSDKAMSTAYAWPYTEMVASNWRIATLSDAAKNYISDFYKNTLEGFKYYKSRRNDYLCYTASRAAVAELGSGDTYYDDNIWIAREFLNAYEILGDEEYLNKSKQVIEYIWSGWAKDELGGIYWFEQRKESRNTCSNAPAVILFSRMYEHTNDQSYLDRAIQIYDFCFNNLRDPSDNVYWDNISNFGVVDTRKYTYNTGSMIAAGVKLYEITKDEKYLDHAKASALGSYNYFFKQSDRGYKTIKMDNPWFNVLLLDGYVELYRHYNQAIEYIQNYEANLNYAYQNLRSEQGFMPANWVNGFPKDNQGNVIIKDLNILDMAANSENFGLLAYFYNYIKK